MPITSGSASLLALLIAFCLDPDSSPSYCSVAKWFCREGNSEEEEEVEEEEEKEKKRKRRRRRGREGEEDAEKSSE